MLDEFEETSAIGRFTRDIVCAVITAGGAATGDPADGVVALHREMSMLLHQLSLEFGNDAVETACTYCIRAFDSKLLFQSGEVAPFVRAIARDARLVSREIAKGTPFSG